MFKKSLIAAVLSLYTAISFASNSTEPTSTYTQSKVDLIQQHKNLYQVKNGDYSVLPQQVQLESPVTEFFSYRCVYCFMYERYMHIGEAINKDVFNGEQKFSMYNIDYAIQDSSDITLAFIIAKSQSKNFQQRFTDAMFDGFHLKNSIQSGEDIFAILGMSNEQLQKLINDKSIQSEYEKEVNIAKSLNIKSTPTFIVNGKYALDIPSIAQGLTEPEKEEDKQLVFAELKNRITTVINYLIDKDKSVKAK